MPQFFSDVAVDFPIIWLILTIVFLYLYRKFTWNWSLNIASFFAVMSTIGFLPDGIQYIVVASIVIALVWSMRLLLCDLCIGIVAPILLSKYRRMQFGAHIGKIHHFGFRHFCLHNEKNEQIYIPYHYYLTCEFRILDRISKEYVFVFPDENKQIRITRVKNYLFDSPFSDCNHWSLEVKENLHVHLQLFREQDTIILQERLHQIFYNHQNQ
jgi:hypothetical protein